MEIKDKVIIITGASSGIGLELARVLSGEGAKLALLARSADKLETLKNELKKTNNDIISVPTDVTDNEQVAAAVKRTVEEFSGIDIVINNAGIAFFKPLEATSAEDLENIIRTNVTGGMYLINCAMEYLKKSKGMIVNVSSGLAKRALPYLSVYAGTKAMLNMLTDGLRMELMDDGIKVLTYAPPETDTPIFEKTTSGLKMPEMKMRKKDPVDVARRMVKAIRKEKKRVDEGGKGLAIMNLLAPGFLDKMFYKVIVKKMKELN